MTARFNLFLISIFVLGSGLGLAGAKLNRDSNWEEINPLARERSQLEIMTQTYWNWKLESCMEIKDEIEKTYCLNDLIIKMTKINGVRLALDVVQPLAQKYPDPFLTKSHELAHVIGDYALDHNYKVTESNQDEDGFTPAELKLIAKIGKALVDCDGWGAFGCYHGVIEVGLARLKPEDRTRVIRKACMENDLIQQHRAYVNQCLHWFGHGMAIFTDQPLAETLKVCEELNLESFASDDVQLCVSGVFHAGAVPGEVDDEYDHYIARVYSPDDPFYPCQEVEEKYKGQCYSQLVGRSGADLKVQFKNCDNIPESDPIAKDNYVRRCYNSGANGLLVKAKFDVKETIELCRDHSTPSYLPYCYGGAIRYSILRDPLLNNAFPFEMCASIEDAHMENCYRSLGAANYENYFDDQILTDYCRRVPEGYKAACLSKDPMQTPIIPTETKRVL